MTRLKDVAVINHAALPETTAPDRLLRYVDIGSVSGLGSFEAEELLFQAAPSRARRLVRPGDTIVSTVRTYLRAVAYIGDEADDLVVSTGFATLTPREGIEPRFLYWLARGSDFIENVVSRSVGVSYPAITAAELGTVDVSVPPRSQQRRVAAFLDSETAEIDQLIDEQNQLVKLVKERLDAAREAVFRDWPERRLKEALAASPTYGVLVPVFVDEGVPFVRVGDIAHLASPAVPERAIDPALSAQHRRTVLSGGEVLVSVVGSLGHAGVVPPRLAGANVARAVAVLRVNPRLTPSLLAHFVRTRRYQDQAALATGSDTAQPTLGMGDLSNFVVPLPQTPTELAEASARLDAESQLAATLLNEIDAQLALLREHRQALISAAVTGGLDALERVA